MKSRFLSFALILSVSLCMSSFSAAQSHDAATADTIPVATLDSVFNYVPINDFLATAGQIEYDEIHLLKEAGFERVVSLATSNADVNGLEAHYVVSEGIGFSQVVMEGAPDMSELDAFFAAMKANEGKKVFVHCNSNRRASAFTFLYRVLVLGEDEAVARADMERIWTPEESEAWKVFFDEALTKTENHTP